MQPSPIHVPQGHEDRTPLDTGDALVSEIVLSHKIEVQKGPIQLGVASHQSRDSLPCKVHALSQVLILC